MRMLTPRHTRFLTLALEAHDAQQRKYTRYCFGFFSVDAELLQHHLKMLQTDSGTLPTAPNYKEVID